MPNLFNETGHNSIDERNTEATRLIDELVDQVGAMKPHEISFVTDMKEKVDNLSLRCSAKQLFWLRDLYGKYVLEE